MKNTLSRRQFSRATLAAGILLAATRLPLTARASRMSGELMSLRFPGSTLDPHARPVTVRFHTPDATVSRLIAPSPHGRDGDFPLCSELIAVPEATTAIEAPPEVSTHLHPTIPQIPLTPAQAAHLGDPEATVTEDLRVVSREQWGADESLMTWEPEEGTPVCVTVHHTHIPSGQEPEYRRNWPAAVRAIYRFHASSDNGGRGWGDIGYHLLIDPEGTVYQGRTTGTPGRAVFSPDGGLVTAGHVLHANTGNIGVCVIGDFDRYHPTTAAHSSLVTVLGALCRARGFDPLGQVHYVNTVSSVDVTRPTISGHRDWQDVTELPEDCPGRNLWYQLPEVRQQVAERG
ncbi:N-acetylmuramoyl-L-alanine amidase [Corynebacterium sp. zg-331]|uniref:peptidoglycan recognition protein family protein n=1 Tax=unclassified Corynebacterium TaxID=2624378 RepID=UPI00128C7972|nr:MULTISPECIES: N-acetylmuramoyl-L-alanine amidase [unclassified Corynebacterium]MBC3185754.1 N-acetylmuramoyl-L-alanine amidase [Corynebacterium sp. zg-331]MPV52247.1 N-acetylmuramoyl-L-alanine amidase [Corynebacterium sp. zg331]